MIPLRFTPARRSLPLGRDGSLLLLPWVLALLVYVASLAGIGLVVIGDALRAAEQSLAGRLTVQVPAEASNARLQTVLALLRQTPGVRSAEVLPPAETARLLEPWLGSPLSVDELPVPRLIDVRFDPDVPVDLATLRRQLASVVSDARLDDHGRWTDGLRSAARPVTVVLAMLIAVALAAVAVLSIFATVTGLSVHRGAVDLFHLLGAGDAEIGRPFALRMFWLGLLGGAIATLGTLLTVIALARIGRIVELPAPVAATGLADWRLWTIPVVIALASGFIAMAGAWMTVLRRLARMG
jgi:cell division transport system permease protein